MPRILWKEAESSAIWSLAKHISLLGAFTVVRNSPRAPQSKTVIHPSFLQEMGSKDFTATHWCVNRLDNFSCQLQSMLLLIRTRVCMLWGGVVSLARRSSCVRSQVDVRSRQGLLVGALAPISEFLFLHISDTFTLLCLIYLFCDVYASYRILF